LLCEEEGRRRVRCEMDKIKTTKGQQLSTLGRARLTIGHVCHT
jgi:hypothetical protein